MISPDDLRQAEMREPPGPYPPTTAQLRERFAADLISLDALEQGIARAIEAYGPDGEP